MLHTSTHAKNFIQITESAPLHTFPAKLLPRIVATHVFGNLIFSLIANVLTSKQLAGCSAPFYVNSIYLLQQK